jgi:hypothetical protein
MNPSIRDYLLSLRDAPYTAWQKGLDVFGPGAPFFGEGGADLPSPAEVFSGGTNCAGLMNIVRLAHCLTPLGGTPGWEKALAGAWQPFDRSASYPAYTLLLRKYRTDYEDEGHLAMLWTGGGPALEQKLYHSWRGGGVTLDASVASSDAWEPEGYYELACLPEDWLRA